MVYKLTKRCTLIISVLRNIFLLHTRMQNYHLQYPLPPSHLTLAKHKSWFLKHGLHIINIV
jgi:hypothetical protein